MPSGLTEGEVLSDELRLRLEEALKQAGRNKPELDVAEGLMSFCGFGVKKDVAEALRKWEVKAQAGKSYASLMLFAFYSGFLGEPKDEVKAQRYLTEIEHNGSPEVQSQFAVSYYQPDGFGFLKNDAKAEQLWLRSASQGWVPSYAMLAFFYIGHMKYDEAVRWLELGHAAGDAYSRQLLGYLCLWIPGKHANAERGVQLLKTAAGEKFLRAHYFLGLAYLNGTGVKQDLGESLRWFRIAADKGHADSQEAVANAYELGLGVSADLNQATEWRKKAATGGSVIAKSKLSVLNGTANQ